MYIPDSLRCVPETRRVYQLCFSRSVHGSTCVGPALRLWSLSSRTRNWTQATAVKRCVLTAGRPGASSPASTPVPLQDPSSGLAVPASLGQQRGSSCWRSGVCSHLRTQSPRPHSCLQSHRPSLLPQGGVSLSGAASTPALHPARLSERFGPAGEAPCPCSCGPHLQRSADWPDSSPFQKTSFSPLL